MASTALPQLRAVHARFLVRMAARPPPLSRRMFDIDSTVLVVYGKEEARIGYNPVKRGRPSCHPLFCVEDRAKDCWHGELRPGDVHTASGTLDLL